MSPRRSRTLTHKLTLLGTLAALSALVLGSAFAAAPASRATRLQPRTPSSFLAALQNDTAAAGSKVWVDPFEKAPRVEANRLYRGVLEGTPEKMDVDVYTFDVPERSFVEVTVALDAWDAAGFAGRAVLFDADRAEVPVVLHRAPERAGEAELLVARLKKGGRYALAISGDTTARGARGFAEYRFALRVGGERTNEPSRLVAAPHETARSAGERRVQLEALATEVVAELEATGSALAARLYDKLSRFIASFAPDGASTAGVGCTYSLGRTRRDATAQGTSTGINVIAPGGCDWTVVSNDPWITVNGSGMGSGNGSAVWTVAANTGEARIGTLTIAGITFTVVQDAGATALPCIKDALVFGNPTFQRPNFTSTGSGVADPCSLSGSTQVAYKAYEFEISGCATTTLTATTCGTDSCAPPTGPTSLNDPVIFIYRTGSSLTDTGAGAGAADPFDPGIPCANLMAVQDDLSGESVDAGGTSGGLGACDDRPDSTLAGLQREIGAGRFVVLVSGISNALSTNFAQNRVGMFNLEVSVGAGCTITQVEAGCDFSIPPFVASHPAIGDLGFIPVTTAPDCTWDAVANDDWITIVTPSGQGNGDVEYTVAANSGDARVGTIDVSGTTFTLVQEAGSFELPCYRDALVNGDPVYHRPETATTGSGIADPCVPTTFGNNFFYKAYEFNLPEGCDLGTLVATTCGDAGCGFATPSGAAERDTVVYLYRSGGSLTDGVGAAGAFNPDEPCANLVAANDDQGTGSDGGLPACGDRTPSALGGLTRTIGPGAFTVVVTSFSSFTTGLFNLHVTVDGASCTPTPICTYSISPTEQLVGPMGGGAVTFVTAQAGCGWTAVSNEPWIRITTGASGSGSQPVFFEVDPYSGDAPRTGTITVAGQTFTVNQDGVCTITCPDPVTVSVDPNQCAALVSYPMPTASASCGTIFCSPPSGVFFPIGTTQVNCSNGTTGNCSFTVTVVDDQPPQINCPTPLTVVTDPGTCTATVFFPVSAFDGCGGGASPTCEPASGSSLSVGTTTVTCTATDAAGNTASCSFPVTVLDGMPPTIVCPDPITVDASAGACSATVAYTVPSATDTCGSATVVCSPNSGSSFPVGSTLVTCTATDAAGLTAICQFPVTVVDTTPPTITCPAPITAQATPSACAPQVFFPPPTASDNCSSALSVQCSPASGSSFVIGTTTVTCTATDNVGLTGSCSFTVTVVDQVAPTIDCPANITQPAATGQCSAVVSYLTPTASDACSGVGAVVCSPSSGMPFDVGTSPVTCTVTDGAGNVNTCSFTVTVTDTQAPVIVCPAPIMVASAADQCGATVMFSASASDNCSGGGSVLCVPASGSFFALGMTPVTCTATDTAGNMAICGFTVTVLDQQAPVVACVPDVVVTGDELNGCTFQAAVTYSAPTATDNCAAGATVVCVPASGTVFAEGATTVTCTATDTAGNSGSCSFTVTVETPFDVCVVGDTPADRFSIVTDPASPFYRLWRYRVAATGETLCGTASDFDHVPNQLLIVADMNDPTCIMIATVSWSSNTAFVQVRKRTEGRTYRLQDANILDDPACP